MKPITLSELDRSAVAGAIAQRTADTPVGSPVEDPWPADCKPQTANPDTPQLVADYQRREAARLREEALDVRLNRIATVACVLFVLWLCFSAGQVSVHVKAEAEKYNTVHDLKPIPAPKEAR